MKGKPLISVFFPPLSNQEIFKIELQWTGRVPILFVFFVVRIRTVLPKTTTTNERKDFFSA